MNRNFLLHVWMIFAILLSSLGVMPALAGTLGTEPKQAGIEGNIHYVKPEPVGLKNCASWEDACDLQTALAGAVAGDEVWVAAGVHYPGLKGALPTVSFQLRSGMALYGGFVGTEYYRQQRSWDENPTILSGDIDRNDLTEGGVVIDPGNIIGTNAYHVVVVTGDVVPRLRCWMALLSRLVMPLVLNQLRHMIWRWDVQPLLQKVRR
jgi:hypothetical protein